MRENLVFFLIVFISIHRIDSILLFRHFNIDIQNKLAANQTLMVYCRDKNTLSEVGFLRFKTVLEVKFIIYPKTLIWCNLWKPNVCFWQVQDDGVWLRHNPSGTLTLMHEWGDKSKEVGGEEEEKQNYGTVRAVGTFGA
ncbi:hypothetical protein YC2023_033975 [Brassica napus]